MVQEDGEGGEGDTAYPQVFSSVYAVNLTVCKYIINTLIKSGIYLLEKIYISMLSQTVLQVFITLFR